jgi:hypothetical protein
LNVPGSGADDNLRSSPQDEHRFEESGAVTKEEVIPAAFDELENENRDVAFGILASELAQVFEEWFRKSRGKRRGAQREQEADD